MSLAVHRQISDWPKITMYGSDFRQECNVMYNVITDLGLWNSMSQEPPGGGGYMFSFAKYVSQIENHPKVVACGHSGATGAYCMRIMQFIARNGWDALKKEFGEKPALNPIEDFSSGTAMTNRSVVADQGGAAGAAAHLPED